MPLQRQTRAPERPPFESPRRHASASSLPRTTRRCKCVDAKGAFVLSPICVTGELSLPARNRSDSLALSLNLKQGSGTLGTSWWRHWDTLTAGGSIYRDLFDGWRWRLSWPQLLALRLPARLAAARRRRLVTGRAAPILRELPSRVLFDVQWRLHRQQWGSYRRLLLHGLEEPRHLLRSMGRDGPVQPLPLGRSRAGPPVRGS